MNDNKVAKAVASTHIHKFINFSLPSIDSLGVWKKQPHFLEEKMNSTVEINMVQMKNTQRRATFTNCFIRLLGSCEVVTQTLGSATPAIAYSSSVKERLDNVGINKMLRIGWAYHDRTT
jgi:hypothetical protein